MLHFHSKNQKEADKWTLKNQILQTLTRLQSYAKGSNDASNHGGKGL